jgi:LysR family transcriptional regulator, benzoate and cis,cis-muconate-responsive activator of ben and cat genes
MNRPDVRELECFIAVAEELHFSKAAKRLHMTQPPLSRQIQILEQKLETQLLRRKTRRVELTGPGRNFLTDAREILYQVDRAAIAANRMQRGESERLRFGFIGYLVASDLVEVLRAFRRARPQCRVELVDMEASRQLAEIRVGQLDGGFFGVGPDEPLSDLKLLTWKKVPLIMVLPEDHALAKKKGKLTLADLKDQDWVMLSRVRARDFRRQIDELCAAAGFLPRIVQESESVHAVMAMVAAGNGIALSSESITGLLKRGLVYQVLNSRGAVVRRNFVWRPESESEALRAFTGVLRGYQAEAPSVRRDRGRLNSKGDKYRARNF